ncbi:DUF4376 domain-containing protein [Diaphorobacter sp. HDW4B]|uniref:DUF4376 domain-containing protein n=1 Tax=Diaphorobacter sp. HDW4B TaxID=2714925 RepID=UPI00140BAF4A|nr:DUF4376 domain-containing protein [Diaphorobacter sp. HDW4B]QIL69516.1 DUF4376 domain-containing protein [Diaphorobacter sp. HDW4B]
MYRFKSDYTGVIRASDGLFISFNDSDPNKPEFDAWAAAGNLPFPPEFTLEELQAQHADSPILPLDRALEWYEDSSVTAPQCVDGSWVRPTEVVDMRIPENLDMLKLRLTTKLAEVRWLREVGGTTLNGVALETDAVAQNKITGAYARATRSPNATVSWKGPDGFTVLSAAEIFAVGDAVFDHVQHCFERERVLSDQINAATTVSALLEIDLDTGWGAA